jgi:hypothetical protein
MRILQVCALKVEPTLLMSQTNEAKNTVNYQAVTEAILSQQ